MKARGLALRVGAVVLGTVALAALGAVPASAQEGLPLPPAVEKELAAKASNVTEVTLGKNMLGFAAKFMKDKDTDEEATRKLIQGLKGIYVREYEFDKEGEYSMSQLQQLRKYFETPEWAPVVRERERKSGETTDVLMKMVNGEPQGMFVLTAEPRELTIVLILGPINMDDLGKLSGLGGLGALGDLDTTPKAKVKDKKGGTE
jgi:hypothetical protein